jgi:hypothetical protein
MKELGVFGDFGYFSGFCPYQIGFVDFKTTSSYGVCAADLIRLRRKQPETFDDLFIYCLDAFERNPLVAVHVCPVLGNKN